VAEALAALDLLSLLPGQALQLLRTARIADLPASCTRALERPRQWCSYKKALCQCAALPPPSEPAPPPRLLSLDCEFKPLRAAAVDEQLRVRLDCVVLDASSFPMMPGVLACDRPLLTKVMPAEARARLLALLGRARLLPGRPPLPGRAPPSPASAAGVTCTGTALPAAGASGTATLLGHTPRHDCDALGLSADALGAVDIAVQRPPPTAGTGGGEGGGKGGGEGGTLGGMGERRGGRRKARRRGRRFGAAVSLSDMARERLGEEMRGGVGRHCAIQDAEVAMRLHLLASAE